MAAEQDTTQTATAIADAPETTTTTNTTASEPTTTEKAAEDTAATGGKLATEDKPVTEDVSTDAAATTKPAATTEGVSTATATATSPFSKLADRLAKITKDTGYSEMWGVDLNTVEPSSHIPTKVVLQKFLRANNGDVDAAAKQLTSALEWRKKVQAPALVTKTFDENKYQGLGYMTVHKDEQGKETVITWNIYGAVKDNKKTFGDVQDFVQWRSALMELGTQRLNLKDATEEIPDDGPDPYQMIQVHDYLSVSFFRMDPHVKAATKETIDTLATAYPELLAHKYFVNVPTIMGWMYAAMKLFLAPATLKKFHPMSSGTTLATELTGIVGSLPKEYGGKGSGVKEQGEEIKLTAEKQDAKKEVIPEGTAEAPVAAVNEEPKPVDTKTEEVKATEPEAKADESKVESDKKDSA